MPEQTVKVRVEALRELAELADKVRLQSGYMYKPEPDERIDDLAWVVGRLIEALLPTEPEVAARVENSP